jgi:L-threonylcarbamoyladenylate synthase
MRISLEHASHLLQEGNVVAVPTETVYGLAASLHSPKAIESIFTLKGRPSDNPLIIHVSSIQEVERFVTFLPPHFRALADCFWPGPMTLVLPIDEKLIPSFPRAGLPTAAFRIPSHPLALELLKMTGPLVMPSANISGRPSSTSSEHVEWDFGEQFPVLDGGRCGYGLESTILIYLQNQWQIIRLGGLEPEAFEPILGYQPAFDGADRDAQPICPGQRYRHYAPKAKLHFLSSFPSEFSGIILGFTDRPYPKSSKVFYLGSLKNPHSVAENLYDILRELDRCKIEVAYIDSQFPNKSLWKTIAERLHKASR